MRDLAGCTAVVTGAGGGIGRGIALALADAGVNVVVADIEGDTADAVAAEVRATGVRSLGLAHDVTDVAAVTALADAAYAEFGAVDILCNNAGVSLKPFRAMWDHTLADWRFVIDGNLWSVINGLEVFVPRMREQEGEKHIVNTSSEAPLMAVSGHIAYTAAKAAVTALSEVAAKELAPYGFGVTILSPGAVRTRISTSERLRPAAEQSANRGVAEYASAEVAHYKDDPDAFRDPLDVGVLVREAIKANQLHLLTHDAPPDVALRTAQLLAGPGIVTANEGTP